MSDAFPPLGKGKEGSGQARRRQVPNPYLPPAQRDFDPYPSRLAELRRRAIEQAYAAEDAYLEQGSTLSRELLQHDAPPSLDGVGFLTGHNIPAELLDPNDEVDEQPTANRPQVFGMSRVIINTPGQAKRKGRRKRKTGHGSATHDTAPGPSSGPPSRPTSAPAIRPSARTPLLSRLLAHAHYLMSGPTSWDTHVRSDRTEPDTPTFWEPDLVLEDVMITEGLDLQLHKVLLDIRRARATRSARQRAADSQGPSTSAALWTEDDSEQRCWDQVDRILDSFLSSFDALATRFSPIRFFTNHFVHGLAGTESPVVPVLKACEAEANRFTEWFSDLVRPYVAVTNVPDSDEHIHVLQDDPSEKVLADKIRQRLMKLLRSLVFDTSSLGPARQNLLLVALLLIRWIFAPLLSAAFDPTLFTLYLSAIALHITPSDLLWLHLSPAGPAYAQTRMQLVYQDLHSELDTTLLQLIQNGGSSLRVESEGRERSAAIRLGLYLFYRASRASTLAPALIEGAYLCPFASEVLEDHANRTVRSFLSQSKSDDAWRNLLFSDLPADADGISLSLGLKHRLMVNAASAQFVSTADSVVWDEMVHSAGRSNSHTDSEEGSDGETWGGMTQSHPQLADPDTSFGNTSFEVGMRIVATTGLDRALAQHGLLDIPGPSRRLHVSIRRGLLVEDSITLFSRLAQTAPNARQLPLSISWAGEEAVDGGGPRKEWISALVATLTNRFDPTTATKQAWGTWLAQLDRKRARALGSALGLAVLHDVPVRPELPFWLYRQLLVGTDASCSNWCLADVEHDCSSDLARRMFLYTDQVGEPVEVPNPDRMRQIFATRLERIKETQEHKASALLGVQNIDEHVVETHLGELVKGFAWMTRGLPLHLLGPGDLRAILAGSGSLDDLYYVPGDKRRENREVADGHLQAHLRQATRHVGFSSCLPGDQSLQDQFWTIFGTDWDATQRSTLLSFVTGAPGLPTGWHTSLQQQRHHHRTSGGCCSPEGSITPAMTLHLVDDPAFAAYVPWSSTCTSTLFIPRMAAHELGPRLRIALQNATAGFGLK